ncbi:prepilin peptidase [Pontibacillus salipaludis]|uniref:Type 4 prepilin-like proteins leader peptide-processing enzyme n=1 Tax=Pontibacillus salipaludis TaxID=1697394 RepID=A0ABQ1PU60_9BACI|nr:A24 family peptidase [Pontibacillus salipaludis]GGD03515.1 type 4 prepilin-like proteins leader peptide-processing enzyme [Pontibacillus salipaludis]
MGVLYLTYFTILGLIFGSFFNVVGQRVPKNEMLKESRSYCPKCGYKLNWLDLYPVLSYITLKGKCRNCKTSISPLYPIVEATTGFLFAYSFIRFGFSAELIVALLFTSLLVIITVTDLTYMLIPNVILLFFLPLLIIGRIVSPLDPWWDSLAGGATGLVLTAIIIIASRGGMGGGDMKLFGVIGIVLGLPGVLLAFFLSTLYGSLISGVLLLFKKIDRKKPVPFGPYIVLGALTSYFFKAPIIDWYLHLF